MKKIKIEVSKKGVEFFLDGESNYLVPLLRKVLMDDIAVIHENNEIYFMLGPHESKHYEFDQFIDARKSASELKEVFLQLLQEVTDWYESIPVSFEEFEVTRIQ